MISLSAAELAHLAGGTLHHLAPEAVIDGRVVTDSRLATPGAVFVAIRGERTDGHDHVPAAMAQGAVLSIVSTPVAGPHVLVTDTVAALGYLARGVLQRLREHGDLQVVGVTGSVGKTTTKDLLAQVLARFGATVAPQASFNNEIGLPLTVLEATEDTRYLVLEMGSSGPGHIDYLTGIAPLDVAVVLVVGQAHLEGFGSIEAVARAKAEILAGLRPGGVAVLNSDDPRVVDMPVPASCTTLTFGRHAPTQFRAGEVRLDDQARPRFTLHLAPTGDNLPVSLALRGDHQVHNALAVLAAAQALGVAITEAVDALAGAGHLSPHRMALRAGPRGSQLLDDAYNANPDSVAAALQALATLPATRRIAVLGDMLELGEASRRQHLDVGRLAAGVAQLVIGAGRYGELVADAARNAGAEASAAADAEEAAVLLQEILQEGDVVLLKGSHGSAMWQLADRLAAEGATDQP